MNNNHQYYRYMTYTEKLREITGSPWQACSGSSLVDVRNKVGIDLVENPGMPQWVFLPSEIQAAEMRAEQMNLELEDLIVTLVAQVIYTGAHYIPGGSLWIEAVAYSQLKGRIAELKEECTGELRVLMVYLEETHELIMLNDLDVGGIPRLPMYDKKKVKGSNQVSRADMRKMAGGN